MVMSPLKASLRVFHGAVGLLGLTMGLYAILLFVRYHRTGLIGEKPSMPWSLYVMGGVGMAMVASAVSGFAAAAASAGGRRGVHALSASVVLLVVTLCMQSTVIVFVFSRDGEWKHHLPEDPSGFWILFSEFLSRHEHQAMLACGGLLCMELLGLALTLWLRTIHQEAYHAWILDVEEQQERERRALGDAAQHAYQGGAESVWNARARTKYGMQSGRLKEETDIMHSVVAPLLTDDDHEEEDTTTNNNNNV